MKHYGLMLASLMRILFTKTLDLLYSLGADCYKELHLKMTASIIKLVNVIEMLSKKEVVQFLLLYFKMNITLI